MLKLNHQRNVNEGIREIHQNGWIYRYVFGICIKLESNYRGCGIDRPKPIILAIIAKVKAHLSINCRN